VLATLYSCALLLTLGLTMSFSTFFRIKINFSKTNKKTNKQMEATIQRRANVACSVLALDFLDIISTTSLLVSVCTWSVICMSNECWLTFHKIFLISKFWLWQCNTDREVNIWQFYHLYWKIVKGKLKYTVHY
jgi:hypothetical protein